MVDRKLRIVRVNSTHLRDKQMQSLFATDARRFHLGACKVSLIWLTSPPRNALLTKKLYHLSRLERALTARIFLVVPADFHSKRRHLRVEGCAVAILTSRLKNSRSNLRCVN
jgi:hypothetical protein